MAISVHVYGNRNSHYIRIRLSQTKATVTIGVCRRAYIYKEYDESLYECLLEANLQSATETRISSDRSANRSTVEPMGMHAHS